MACNIHCLHCGVQKQTEILPFKSGCVAGDMLSVRHYHCHSASALKPNPKSSKSLLFLCYHSLQLPTQNIFIFFKLPKALPALTHGNVTLVIISLDT